MLKKVWLCPDKLVTDDPEVYAALPVILEWQDDRSVVDGVTIEQEFASPPDDENTRCRVSRVQGSPRFLSTHAATYNTFNVQRHLILQEPPSLSRVGYEHMA